MYILYIELSKVNIIIWNWISSISIDMKINEFEQ